MTAKFNSIPPPTYGSKSCLTPYDSINLPLVDYSDSEDDEFETCPEFQSQVEFQDDDDDDDDDESESDSDELDPSDFDTDIDYQVYLATLHFDDGGDCRDQRCYDLKQFLDQCVKELWCPLCAHPPGSDEECFCHALHNKFHCQGCGEWNFEYWCEETGELDIPNECECELVNATDQQPKCSLIVEIRGKQSQVPIELMDALLLKSKQWLREHADA